MVFGIDDAIIGGTIAAVGSVAGAGIGAASASASGRRSEASSAASQERQFYYDLLLSKYANDFTERMSNTSYQRQVSDMRKAGINPMLAIQGSGGASTPSAGSGSVGMQGASYDFDPVGSGLAVANAINQFKEVASQTKLNKSQIALNKDVQSNYKALTSKYFNDILNDTAMTNSTIANNNAKTAAEVAYTMKQTELLPLKLQIDKMNAQANISQANSASRMADYHHGRLQMQNQYDYESARHYSVQSRTIDRDYQLSGGNRPSDFQKVFHFNKYFRPISLSN